jgi:hypothetical protein
MDGHPTMYMKILHYVVFYSSGAVRNYLYSKDIAPETIHLNDYKFMERIFYIIVSLNYQSVDIFLLDEYFWSQAQDFNSAILQIWIC